MVKKQATKYSYDLCVIGGAGHIGLPLGVAFALKGVKTVLLDINQQSLRQIKAGKFPFKEKDGEKSLKRALASKNLFVSQLPEAISKSRFVSLVIGTPIDEYLNPDFHGIIKTIDKYFRYFKNGQIVILRSTVYPGTSEKIQQYFQERNKKVTVSFCPERIVEGQALEELKSLPQIISAFDQDTLWSVTELFKRLTNRKIIPVQPLEAELAKLFTNSWRYIKFAVANQFFTIAKEHDLDYHKIYRAMNEDYDRNRDIALPGFTAGPCLLKDTMQLAAFNDNNFFLGHTAMLVNEGLPNFLIQDLIKKIGPLQNKKLGILGMAFKAESDDIRDSLSFKLWKLGETKFHQVRCHDFFVKHDAFLPLGEVVRKSEVIILAAPHKKYKKINPLKYKNKIFIDVWNFWGRGSEIKT